MDRRKRFRLVYRAQRFELALVQKLIQRQIQYRPHSANDRQFSALGSDAVQYRERLYAFARRVPFSRPYERKRRAQVAYGIHRMDVPAALRSLGAALADVYRHSKENRKAKPDGRRDFEVDFQNHCVCLVLLWKCCIRAKGNL